MLTSAGAGKTIREALGSPFARRGLLLWVALLATAAFALLGGSVCPGQARAASAPTGQIAFVRDGGIWVMDADGSHQKQLTHSSTDRYPSWSPDGESITFVRAVENSPGEVHIIAADGSGDRRVPFPLGLQQMPGTAHAQEDYHIMTSAWSPDGTDLTVVGWVYSEYPDTAEGINESQVFLVHPDGTDLRRIGPLLPGSNERLSWRPDGAQLLLTQYYKMAYSNVKGLDVATGRYSNLQGEVVLTFATWSPDGRSIAAGYAPDQMYVQGPADLVVFGDLPGPRTVVSHVDRGFDWTRLYPSWSPDGKWLAYAVEDGFGDQATAGIEVVAATGGSSRALADNADQPAWRPVLPPPAPTLRLADDDFNEGTKLRVSGEVKNDGHGAVDRVAIYVGKQRWDVRVDSSGRYSGELQPLPGDYRVTAAAVRDGVEGQRSAAQLLRIRGKGAVLFGFDEGWLLHSYGVVNDWVAPLQAKGWSARPMRNSDAGTAARLMQGKGLVVFYGHGLYVATAEGKDPLPGFALAFGDTYLATTHKVVDYASGGGSPRWETLDAMDLSALQVAVYLGCGTGENSGNPNSLLAYTTGSGADVAVGFTREVYGLVEPTPWLNAFRDYTLQDGNDVRTAAFRAEQDCAVFGPMVAVNQRNEVKNVYIDQAPPWVDASSTGGGW